MSVGTRGVARYDPYGGSSVMVPGQSGGGGSSSNGVGQRYFDYASYSRPPQPTTTSPVRPTGYASSSSYSSGPSYGAPQPTKPYVTYNPYNSGGTTTSTSYYGSSSSSRPSYGAPTSTTSYSSAPAYGTSTAYGVAKPSSTTSSYGAPTTSAPSYASYGSSSYAKPTTSSYPGSSYSAPVQPSTTGYPPYGSSTSYAKPTTTTTTTTSTYGKPTTTTTTTSTSSYGGYGTKPTTTVAPTTTSTSSYGGYAPKPTTTAPTTTSTPSTSTVVKPPPSDPYAAYGGGAVSCAVTRAVFIGCNYTGQKGLELRGCINDVNNSMTMLKDMGFDMKEEENTRVLTDNRKRRPVKSEMLAAMAWLTKDNKAGDVLWFHYSGHGSQERDTSGEEDDGMNESIIPIDYYTNGSIIDNDLYKLLVQPLKAGVVLYAIFDCCHSGTILDLRYVFDEAQNKLEVDEEYRERRPDEGVVYMLSGCMSAQTSADLPPDAKMGLKAQSVGAMTGAYLPLVNQGNSWAHFVKGVRTGLKKSRLQQVPQFEISRSVPTSEIAFVHAFPTLSQTGKGASGEEEYVPHEDVRSLGHSRLEKLKQKRQDRIDAKAAEAEASTTTGSRGLPVRGGTTSTSSSVYGRVPAPTTTTTRTTSTSLSSVPPSSSSVYSQPTTSGLGRYPGHGSYSSSSSSSSSLSSRPQPGVGPVSRGIPSVQPSTTGVQSRAFPYARR